MRPSSEATSTPPPSSNVRFWVDGPQRDATQVDAAVRDHVRAMQRRALELQVPMWEEADEEPLVPDLGDRLGEIRQPALVLVGEVDQPDIHAIAARLVAGTPGRRLRDDPGRRAPAEPRAARAVRPARDRLPQCERTGLSERAMASISGSVRSSSSVFCTQ